MLLSIAVVALTAVPALATDDCGGTTGTEFKLDMAQSSSATLAVVSNAIVVTGATGCAGPYPTGTYTSILVTVAGSSNTGETLTLQLGGAWPTVLVQLESGGGDKVVLKGTSGNDTIVLGTTIVTPYLYDGGSSGYSGVDIFELQGLAGNDALTGNADADILRGGDGDDTLTGGNGDDILVGGLGNDTFATDSGGTDTISFDEEAYPGANNGFGIAFSLSFGGAQITGGAGTDTCNYCGIENLTGSGFGDRFTGGGGVNVISGGGGDDIIEGLAGVDTLTGGESGETYGDTLSYINAPGSVTVDLSATPPSAVVTGSGDLTDILVTGDFENIRGSNLFPDELTGDSAANKIEGMDGGDTLRGGGGTDTIIGNDGADILMGGLGNDTLVGGPGADSMSGGGGTGDTISYDNSAYPDAATMGITFSLALATWQPGGYGSDICSDGEVSPTCDVENLTGSAFNDSLTGSSVANTILGWDGDDMIEGGGGADGLSGGEGNETNGDTLTYANSPSGVTVNLGATTPSGGDAAGDTLADFENLVGSAYTDTLTGDDSPNRIRGGAQADTIEGKGGADNLDGEGGVDTLSYTSDAAGVTVSLPSTASGGDAAGDTIANFETVWGGTGADTLKGDSGANSLSGGDGDDSLNGGRGDDTLYGDAGNDTLLYGGGADVLNGGEGLDSCQGYTGTASGVKRYRGVTYVSC